MNIGMVVPSWPPGQVANGIITYTQFMVDAYRQLGHKVYIFTFSLAGESDEYTKLVDTQCNGKFRNKTASIIERILPGGWGCLALGWALNQSLREVENSVQFDFIEMEESFGWNILLDRDLRRKVVVKLHGPHFMVNGNPAVSGAKLTLYDKLRSFLEGEGLKRAALITAPSAYVLSETINKYSLQSQKTKVVPNPVNTKGIGTWHFNNEFKDTILFVGRFDAIKGAHILLKAFCILRHKLENIKLVFVGPDSGLPSKCGKKIHIDDFLDSIGASNLKENIEFTGKLSPADIALLRARSFITIVPSTFDNFPNTLLEAMAFGSPVIATRVGGIPEIVEGNVSGILVNGNDEKALAESIESLMNDVEYAKSLGVAAKTSVAKNYSPVSLAKGNLDFVINALNKSY